MNIAIHAHQLTSQPRFRFDRRVEPWANMLLEISGFLVLTLFVTGLFYFDDKEHKPVFGFWTEFLETDHYQLHIFFRQV